MRIEPRDSFRTPLRHRRGPAERLRAAIDLLCGGQGTVVSHDQRSWASITFSGARHRLVLRFEGTQAAAGGETLIERLPEHEFAIPGHIVSDATICSVQQALLPAPQMTVEIELLLLEDS